MTAYEIQDGTLREVADSPTRAVGGRMTPTTNNVGPTTSATERLRALLDERGVEWWPMHDVENGYHQDRDTEFVIDRKKYTAHERGGTLNVYGLTTEQAVAATLGETPTPHVEDLGRLHDELRDAIVEILGNRCDWDQAGVRHAHEVLERAATLGRGTCRFE